MSVEKGQISEINPTYWLLRQNIPTNVVRFHTTAECNRRTCAVSHFGGNLLPAAVLAPAVAICLKSLISRQQKKSGFVKNRARKGLPKSTQRIAETSLGVERHSKESGSGVFARDSEVEREELYSNEQKNHIDVHQI